jgi:protein-L-isoaspartate(D-aspartate) O-methyltransferase
VERLRSQGIDDLAVLHAFDVVPRHLFVPEALQLRAYEDAPLPIGFGQTISQPSMHARVLQGLELKPTDRVLEVGTGSGFQTALLAQLSAQVYSIERIAELARRARFVLDALGPLRVALRVGDGSVGWRRYAPFDAIVVSAAVVEVPAALREQLVVGGRLVAPVGTGTEQRLMRLRRTPTGEVVEDLGPARFLPLVPRATSEEAG